MPLKASPDDQAHLLELQAIDTRLQQLDHKAKTLPQVSELASLASELDDARQQSMSVTGALEDARLELSRVEDDVAVVEKRMERDTQRMQSTSSVKDITAFEAELAGLRTRKRELEDVQLEVMERVENLEGAAGEARAAADGLQERIAAVELDRDAALAGLDGERNHALANRSTIVGGLPEELVALYERQRSRYGFGASMLQGGVSSASGVRLNESDMALVRAADADDVLLCPDSDAILVRTKESGL